MSLAEVQALSDAQPSHLQVRSVAKLLTFSDAHALMISEARAWNLDRMGEAAIATTDNLGDAGYNTDPAGDYCHAKGRFGFGGTSAAAAQVAGVVALMLAANPSLKGQPGEVKKLLRETASRDCLTAELEGDEFGSGLVDAAAAVAAAGQWDGKAEPKASGPNPAA